MSHQTKTLETHPLKKKELNFTLYSKIPRPCDPQDASLIAPAIWDIQKRFHFFSPSLWCKSIFRYWGGSRAHSRNTITQKKGFRSAATPFQSELPGKKKKTWKQLTKKLQNLFLSLSIIERRWFPGLMSLFFSFPPLQCCHKMLSECNTTWAERVEIRDNSHKNMTVFQIWWRRL